MAHKAKIGESLSERERFCIDAVLFNSDNTDLAYIQSPIRVQRIICIGWRYGG